MNKKTITVAGFLAVTVLQGISYPSIALGDELIQTQNQSTSQQGNETLLQNSEESISSEEGNSDTTQNDSTSQPTAPTPSTQTDNTDTSNAITENEPSEKQYAESGPQDDPVKPENGWDENKQHYYGNGVMAVDKDAFIPNTPDDRKTGIWVRFNQDGDLIKGEDYRYGGWYYFDTTTGAMVKGVKYISSEDKWVYYDVSTDKMAHGEAYLHYDKKHTG